MKRLSPCWKSRIPCKYLHLLMLISEKEQAWCSISPHDRHRKNHGGTTVCGKLVSIERSCNEQSWRNSWNCHDGRCTA